MQIRLLTALAAAGALVSAAAQAATPVHVYDFDGGYAATGAGPAMTAKTGSTFATEFGRSGLRFSADRGPGLTGAAIGAKAYAIETYFSLDTLPNYAALINFDNLTRENAIYATSTGSVTLWPVKTGHDVFKAKTLHHLVVSRTEADVLDVYVDGKRAFTYSDAGSLYTRLDANRTLQFFSDNLSEASSGFVDFVKIYDAPVAAGDVQQMYAAVAGVPEPATWASMIGGFGLAGGSLRRRRSAAAA